MHELATLRQIRIGTVRRWRYEPQPAARPHQVRLVVSPP